MVGEPISVSINDFASGEEIEAVGDAFDRAGIDATVKANYIMKSADLVPWIVSITLAYAAASFFQGFFGKLGADAATKMQEWVRDVRKAWESSAAKPGGIVIRGQDRTIVVIGDPPEQAYGRLLQLDWDELAGGYLLWDDDAGEWQDKNPR